MFDEWLEARDEALHAVFAGPGSRVRYVNLQDYGDGVTHLAVQRMRLSRDADVKSLSVAFGGSLARTEVTARGRLYVEAERVEAKLRYRSPAVPARVEPTARGFRLVLDEPGYGVAAGQAAVLYDGDTVVGYGLITASH